MQIAESKPPLLRRVLQLLAAVRAHCEPRQHVEFSESELADRAGALAGCQVVVHQQRDGTLSLTHGPHCLGRYDAVRAYGLTAHEIATTVERLLQVEVLAIENEQEVFTAMAALKQGRGSFSDALIAELGARAGMYSDADV